MYDFRKDSMDIIEDLYAANDIHTGRTNPHQMYEYRQQHQREAISKMRILAYIAQLALEQKAILPKQYFVDFDREFLSL